MIRPALLLGAASFLGAFFGTVAAANPSIVPAGQAQEAGIRAEQVLIVERDGTERLRLGTDPETSAELIGANGVVRVRIGTGGTTSGAVAPDNSGVSLFSSNGVRLARLGTGRGATGTGELNTSLVLSDRQETQRIRLNVGDDGSPSIQMYDADGDVIWTAP